MELPSFIYIFSGNQAIAGSLKTIDKVLVLRTVIYRFSLTFHTKPYIMLRL